MSQHPIDLFRTSCGATAPLELNVSGPDWEGCERRVFEHPFVLVGRHERSCLRLDDGAVSQRHAYLQQLGGKVFCVDLGSRTGIRWGGESRSAGWLRPEQGVQIGPFTLELAMTAPAGEGAGERVGKDWDPLQDRSNDPRLLPHVTLEVGNEVVSRLCMNRVLVLVGSSPACRIRLRDARVSRYHCSLVRTAQGVWLIDLLQGTGTCLNGRSLRYALVKEGDRLQVGPYVLRVWYPDGSVETTPSRLVQVPAEPPVPPVDGTLDSGQRPSQDQGSLEPAATDGAIPASTLQAELDQARACQQDVEILRQQLADRQAECNRLREQARDLEVKVAEMAGLQARLEVAEASSRQLEVVHSERDRWQSEAEDLQARLAVETVEREQLRRLEANFHAVQRERDRLQSEQQTFQQTAEQAWVKVSELERALTEATAAQATALEEAHACWESERQTLEARLALEGQNREGAVQDAIRGFEVRAAGEREEWLQQLEAAQRQLVEEREAVRTAVAHLDEESAILQEVQADLAVRNAEHDAVLQRLQEAQNELALVQEEVRGLRAELDRARERQRDIEALRQQLADVHAEHAQLSARVPELEDQANAADLLEVRLRDSVAEMEQLRMQLQAAESREAELQSVRTECDRLREQARDLAVKVAEMAGLQARLEVAEASSRQLEVVRSERDRWQSEAQDLQAQLAAELAEREQLNRLSADLQDAQRERDRLQSEQQTSQQTAEQAWATVSELERALMAATAAQATALEEAHACWESERQTLEARLALEGQSREAAIQAAVRTVQTRAVAEREEWRQQLEGAERQLLWERGMFQEQSEQIRRQVASLQAERDRLAAQLTQAMLRLQATAERSPDEDNRAAELQRLRQQAVRDQVFAQLAGLRLGQMLPQNGRPQGVDALAEQARPSPPTQCERASLEEQRRRTAVAQEVQAPWEEAAVGQARLPASSNPPSRVGGQTCEVGLDASGEKAVEYRSAPAAPPAVPADEGEASAPSDTPPDSAARLGESQPAEDAHDCLPERKGSRAEARPRLWRQILGFVLRK